MRTFKEMLRDMPCAYCGAKSGEPCRSVSGKAVPAHSKRFYATKQYERRVKDQGQV